MTSMFRRVLPLLLVLTVAACKGGDKEPARAPTAAPTEQAAATATLDDAAAAANARDVVLNASEQAQKIDSMRGHMSMSFGLGGEDIGVEADMQFRFPDAMHMTMSVFGEDVEMLMYLPNMYMNVPGQGWRKLDTSATPGFNIDQLKTWIEDHGAVDLEQLADHLKELDQLPDYDIDGKSYAHYAGTVDFAEWSKDAPEGLLDQQLQDLVNDAVSDVNVEFFIDEATSLPRRVTMGFEMDLPGAENSKFDMKMDFTGYNEPVSIPEEPVGAPVLSATDS